MATAQAMVDNTCWTPRTRYSLLTGRLTKKTFKLDDDMSQSRANAPGKTSMWSVHQRACLQLCDIFRECSEQFLDLLAKKAESLQYEAGQVIHRTGEPAKALLIVKSGELEVAHGTDQLKTSLTGNPTFGEMLAIFGHKQKWRFFLHAKTACECLTISHEALAEALAEECFSSDRSAVVAEVRLRATQLTEAVVDETGYGESELQADLDLSWWDSLQCGHILQALKGRSCSKRRSLGRGSTRCKLPPLKLSGLNATAEELSPSLGKSLTADFKESFASSYPRSPARSRAATSLDLSSRSHSRRPTLHLSKTISELPQSSKSGVAHSSGPGENTAANYNSDTSLRSSSDGSPSPRTSPRATPRTSPRASLMSVIPPCEERGSRFQRRRTWKRDLKRDLTMLEQKGAEQEFFTAAYSFSVSGSCPQPPRSLKTGESQTGRDVQKPRCVSKQKTLTFSLESVALQKAPDNMESLEAQALLKVPIFKHCSQGFVGALAREARVTTVQPGASVFQQDEPAESLFVLISAGFEVVSGDVAVPLPVHASFGEMLASSDTQPDPEWYVMVRKTTEEPGRVVEVSSRAVMRALEESAADAMIVEAEIRRRVEELGRKSKVLHWLDSLQNFDVLDDCERKKEDALKAERQRAVSKKPSSFLRLHTAGATSINLLPTEDETGFGEGYQTTPSLHSTSGFRRSLTRPIAEMARRLSPGAFSSAPTDRSDRSDIESDDGIRPKPRDVAGEPSDATETQECVEERTKSLRKSRSSIFDSFVKRSSSLRPRT